MLQMTNHLEIFTDGFSVSVMSENAFSVIHKGERLSLEYTANDFTIKDSSASLARFLGIESHFTLKPIDTNDCISGNSIEVAKLTLDDARSFHVKLIDAPDAESVYLASVLQLHPGLKQDTSVLVPIVIDVVNPTTDTAEFYIHITPWQDNGVSLSVMLIKDWITGRRKDVEMALFAFGQFLQGFHKTYPGLMHNDMNPSNVLLVHRDEGFTFVLADCAGFDDEVGDDRRTFLESLGVLTEGGFGEPFLQLATRAFQAGYDSLS